VKFFGGGASSGGGTVTSVFGRVGAVVATLGDYVASQVNNDSSVSGATVKDALNSLLAAIPSVPVSSVFGRVGAVVAVAGDYVASKVNNDSSVTGTTVKDALNNLLASSGTPLLTGTALTNADQTLATSERYVMLPGVTSAIRTKTLTPGANGAGFLVEIGTQGNNVVLVNGGTAGGTLYTVLAGTKFAVWVTSDGTDLVNPTFMPLGAEPIV